MNIAHMYWQDRSIRFKLNCIFLVIIVVSMLTLGIMVSRQYSQNTEALADRSTLKMMHQVANNFELYVNHLKDLLGYIGTDPQIIDYLTNGTSLTDEAEQDVLNSTLHRFADHNPEIAGMMLVGEDGRFYGYKMHRIERDPLTDEYWYKSATSEPRQSLLLFSPIGRNITTDQTYSSEDVISFIQAIQDQNHHVIGALLMDVRKDAIKAMFDSVQLGQNEFMYIVDDKGEIIYSPINTIVYQIRNEWFKNDQQGKTYVINNHEYRILTDEFSTDHWQIVGVIPNDDYQKIVSDVSRYSLIFTLVTLLFATVASTYFTGTIIRPVRKLMRLMKRVEKGDLQQHFSVRTRDEIGQLGESFNRMIDELQNLINLVYIEQKKKREAELQVLQAQIKPHFLYNTLDTIQWMAQEYKAVDVIQMIGALTNLFRIGLSKGNEWITIGEEIKHADSYMFIQMARYLDILTYEINIPEGLRGYKVLKLILQPIIENAIYHGIKARMGKGLIRIWAEREDDLVRFYVEDNGAGIPPDKLADLNRMLSGAERNGKNPSYGLYNVHARIQLTYGTTYGVRVLSELDKGTTVIVEHPLLDVINTTGGERNVESHDRG